MLENKLTGNRPTRIVLNFSHRCNMACKWCYVPFGDSPPKVETCRRIVARSAEIGISAITFGGGDPFMYSFLGEIILSAKRLGLFVHVDTNGIAMRPSTKNADLLNTLIDLLGLPLDGPDAQTHGSIRSSPQHFQILLDRLSWILPFRHKLKLNTIVTAENVSLLPEMARLIASIRPNRWSLYQYWPLSDGASVRTDYEVENSVFLESTENLAGLPALADVKVEVNPLLSRRLSYPFINHEGSLYIHSMESLEEYECIGSIFIDRVVDEMFRRCGAERSNATSRYKMIKVFNS